MKKIFILLMVMASTVSFTMPSHALDSVSVKHCQDIWRHSSAWSTCYNEKISATRWHCVIKNARCENFNDTKVLNPDIKYTPKELLGIVNCNGKLRVGGCWWW